MIICIRHSDDDDSDPTFKHDNKINPHGKRLARRRGKRLIRKYGIPDMVIHSPFRRVCETVSYMLSTIEHTPVKCIIDNGLSRYFSKKDQRRPEVSRHTMKHNIPVYETISEFNIRVKDTLTHLSSYIESDAVVWVVTHAMVYKRMATAYGIHIPSHIPFMHYFALNDNTIVNPWCRKCKKYHTKKS